MRQGELKLIVRGKRKFDDIPTLKEMLDRKSKRPKHLAYLSDKAFETITKIFKRNF